MSKSIFAFFMIFCGMLLAGIGTFLKLEEETYTVTFINEEEQKIVEVKKGQMVSEVKIEDEHFLGWYEKDSDLKFDFNTPITNDISVIAKYEERFTIKFDTNGGNEIKEVYVYKNEKLKEPIIPVKDNNIFVEWQLNGIKYDFDTNVTSDFTLTAVWQEVKDSCVVTFDTKGGNVMSPILVEKNDKITQPINPTKNGYEFVEWQLDGQKYDFNTSITSDITLTAIWKEKKQLQVTFENNGVLISSQKVYEGEKITNIPNLPSKTGYEFVEWQLNGQKYNFDSKVTTDITLKAVWKKIEEFLVTFKADGTVVDSKVVYSGDKLGTLPKAPSKDGYTFKGWYSGSIQYTDTTIIKNNTTLTAVYTSNNEIKLNSIINKIKTTKVYLDSGSQDITSQFKEDGCSIDVINFPSQIERGISNSNLTVKYKVVCGNETKEEEINVIVKASPYKYSKVANSNMLNFDVTIEGGNWNYDAKLFLGNEGSFNVISRKAIVENAKIEDNPTFKMRFNNDNTTIYIVPFKG